MAYLAKLGRVLENGASASSPLTGFFKWGGLMKLENINSDIMDRVISEMSSYNYNSFTDEDIREALNKDYLSVRDFQALLSPKAMNYS